MSVLARVAKNTSWTLAASLWSKGANGLFFILASRLLGPEEIGRFGVVQAVLFYFLFLSSFGLAQTAVREISRDRARAEELFINVFSLRLILATVSSVAFTLLLIFGPYRGEMRFYLAVSGISIFTVVISDTTQALFVAHERLKIPALFGMITSGISAIGGAIALLLGGGLLWVFVVIVGANIFVAGLNAWYVRREYVGHRFQLDRKVAKELLVETFPLGLLLVLMIAHGRIDILMLAEIPGGSALVDGGIPELRATGCYGVAYKVFEAVSVAVIAARMALLPTISAAMAAGKERVRQAYLRGSQVLTLVYAVPLVCLVPFGARWLIGAVFGEAFTLATVPVIVLSFAYAMYAYNAIMLPILINSQRLLSFALYGFVVVGVNIGLNWILIPEYSLYGAAVATLVSTLVMMAIKFHVLSIEFGASAWFRVPLKTLLPMVLMVSVAAAIYFGLHSPPLAVLVGGTVYYYGLARFNVLEPADRALFAKAFGKARAAISRLS
jgi:O-antigen/teichoic acid export membrane protein